MKNMKNPMEIKMVYGLSMPDKINYSHHCERCEYSKFDHYVEGAPGAVYTCNHPDKENIEGCPLEELNVHKTISIK